MTDANRAFFKAFRSGDANGVRDALGGDVDLVGETFKSLTTGRIDLGGLDLSNSEFDACLLSGIRFADADLSGAYFHGTTLIECDFSGANLEGASFDGCVFKETTFAAAKLRETELKGVEFDACNITDASLDDAVWESITFNGGTMARVSGTAELTAMVIRDAELAEFDTADMTLNSCTTNVTPTPTGFTPLSGRRKRIE